MTVPPDASFLQSSDPAAIPPRWQPVCPVCGERIGPEACLDVLDKRDGGQFRLTCTRDDDDHAEGVIRHYGISVATSRHILENVSLKTWADPGNVLAAVAEWLFAEKLVGRRSA